MFRIVHLRRELCNKDKKRIFKSLGDSIQFAKIYYSLYRVFFYSAKKQQGKILTQKNLHSSLKFSRQQCNVYLRLYHETPLSPLTMQLQHNQGVGGKVVGGGVGNRIGRNPTKLRWQTVILQSKLNLESNSMDRFDVFFRPAAEINLYRAELQMRKHNVL